MNTLAKLGVIGCCLVLASTAVYGQNPTFSLDIVDVNGSPPTGGRSMTEAAPGDIITIELRLRDWSPTGQGLRGFQAALDYDSYFTGNLGNVLPKDFATTTDVNGYCSGGSGVLGTSNTANALMDTGRGDYIFSGYTGFPSVASNACDYWYTGALLFPPGPVAPQDGTSFYCGTVILEVSADAQPARSRSTST